MKAEKPIIAEQPMSEPRYDERNGNLLCNAKGNSCGGWAMKPSAKCRVHGGASPRGIAASRYKNGLHSRYLTAMPEKLKGAFLAALRSKDLISLRDEVALIDCKTKHALSTLTGEESLAEKATWSEILELIEARRKLVDSESRRVAQAQESLTSSQAQLLFSALVAVVVENVADRETRARIQSGFIRLVGSNESRKEL